MGRLHASTCPVVFVPGNHDPAIEHSAGSLLGCTSWTTRPTSPRPHGAIDADRRIVEAAGLRIAGLGGCVRYQRGPHQYTQREYHRHGRRLLRRARRGGPVDVLLTHAPPSGSVTATTQPTSASRRCTRCIDRLEPTWHLHGHIHPYGRQMPDRAGRTARRSATSSRGRMVDIEPQSPHRVDPLRLVGRDNAAMVRDTGSPRGDAECDFLRVRRHQTLSKLAPLDAPGRAGRLTETLSFNEVVDALGRRGEHDSACS